MSSRQVVVWASTEALGRVACEALEGHHVVLLTGEGDRGAILDADAGVVVRAGPGPDAATTLALHALAERAPLVWIAAEPPSTPTFTAWLPALPDPPALGRMIDALVAAGPISSWTPLRDSDAPRSTKPWRRKTDFILGDSPHTRDLLREIDRVAPSATTVLVSGESGTGKELVASALHYCGPRAREPFVAVNCAAIPEALFEAELFGHQRGAFTGAVAQRAGAFEAAGKGTLFLDEIGEMPRALQAKLLRVLETSSVVRLGSSDPRPVHARIVVATNRDLEVEVREGRFREDLYYRLHVYPLHVAPLRERAEDIAPIAYHHIALIAQREGRPAPRLSATALERLLGYHWPGNVRELVHVLNRAILTTAGDTIEADRLVISVSGEHAAVTRYRDAKAAFERDYYSRVLKVAGGNVTRAARLADKTRKEVYDALRRVGVEAIEYRAVADGDVENK